MRFKKIEGLDYKRGAIDYPNKLAPEDQHHLLTKPFYNLAHKHDRWAGDGLDADSQRHFCDFANMAVTLALPAGARILDVGCGSGWLCEYFARLGYQMTGIDISPDLIAMANERLNKVPYGAGQEADLSYRFAVHDIEDGALSETFDAIICYDSLHHFEDEQAVLRNIAAMLDYGGQLFVLEGELPPAGSETETELRAEMAAHETLESPFGRDYLLSLLRQHGFAVVGDYVSVNGLFDREMLHGKSLSLNDPGATNYLLCKKVDGEIADSRNPGILRARITLRDDEAGSSLGPRASRPLTLDTLTIDNQSPLLLSPGATINLPIEIENTGDTLWLVSRAAPKGTVRLGVKTLNEADGVINEVHGSPPLPRAMAPRETVKLVVKYSAPQIAGRYTLKIDLVCQDICWFEQRESKPLVLPFDVNG